MDMKLLDEVKKMAALDQADKEFLKRTEKRMGHFLKEGIDLFCCFFFRLWCACTGQFCTQDMILSVPIEIKCIQDILYFSDITQSAHHLGIVHKHLG